jgi:hypothetical protein
VINGHSEHRPVPLAVRRVLSGPGVGATDACLSRCCTLLWQKVGAADACLSRCCTLLWQKVPRAVFGIFQEARRVLEEPQGGSACKKTTPLAAQNRRGGGQGGAAK